MQTEKEWVIPSYIAITDENRIQNIVKLLKEYRIFFIICHFCFYFYDIFILWVDQNLMISRDELGKYRGV